MERTDVSMKRVVIIGAGLGGLSAAIYLSRDGYDVTVLEKRNQPGGKLHKQTVGDASFDFGPNTITMPDVFQDVLTYGGDDEPLPFIKLQDHTMNYFKNDAPLLFSSDERTMEEQLSQSDYSAFQQYKKTVARIFHMSKTHFFTRSFTSWRDYLNPRLATALTAVKPFTTMHAFHRSLFKDERLIQALDRYATYVGSSPYQVPATFTMIAHLEFNDGVYYVQGGNTKIAKRLESCAKNNGVSFHYGEEATSLRTHEKKITEVITQADQSYACDHVILNGDLLTQTSTLLKTPPPAERSFTPSSSAFVMMLRNNQPQKNLQHHHQVYFADNYKREFHELFKAKRYVDEPTIYISNSSSTDRTQRRHGDNLYVLVNAPALSDSLIYDSETYRSLIFKRLQTFGVNIEYDQQMNTFTPMDIAREFGAYKGAIYGLSSNTLRQAFLRPFNASTTFNNLTFTGGSTHPGGGSPLVVLSGKLAASHTKKMTVH